MGMHPGSAVWGNPRPFAGMSSITIGRSAIERSNPCGSTRCRDWISLEMDKYEPTGSSRYHQYGVMR